MGTSNSRRWRSCGITPGTAITSRPLQGRPDNSHQPTALVHEAWLRLVGNENRTTWLSGRKQGAFKQRAGARTLVRSSAETGSAPEFTSGMERSDVAAD